MSTTLRTTLATALCLTSTMAVLTLLRMTPGDALPGAVVEGGVNGVNVNGGADGEGEPPERPSLAGRLLVASPQLDDPYFAGTVIYMLADDEDGALGVVLNRARDHEEQQSVTIFDGGPVGRNRVFVLHDDVDAPGSVHIGDVAVAADPAILDELFAGRGPAHARVFVGYAGWGPGQLDGEITEGAWRTMNTTAGFVLSNDLHGITSTAYAPLSY